MVEGKPLGIAWLGKARVAYRKLTEKEKKVLDMKFEPFLKKYEKKGARFLSEYGPVVGTTWSRVQLWEFPDFDTFVEFRKEYISLFAIFYEFKPILLGRSEPPF